MKMSVEPTPEKPPNPIPKKTTELGKEPVINEMTDSANENNSRPAAKKQHSESETKEI